MTTALPQRGTIWTWTVQRFPPKPPFVIPPTGFTPFAVGYVDLGPVVVESLLAAKPEQLHIDQPVHLVRHPVSGGDGAWTYAFAP